MPKPPMSKKKSKLKAVSTQDKSGEESELERLRRENAELKKKAAGKAAGRLEFKVAKNNFVSIYYGGRFPANIPANALSALLTKTKRRALAWLEEQKEEGNLEF